MLSILPDPFPILSVPPRQKLNPEFFFFTFDLQFYRPKSTRYWGDFALLCTSSFFSQIDFFSSMYDLFRISGQILLVSLTCIEIDIESINLVRSVSCPCVL